MSEDNGRKTRFIHGEICPVCGGCEEDPRGKGKRCWGFIRGESVHCTRVDFANGCDFHSGSETYSHRLKGKCKCGAEHKPANSKPGKARAEKTLEHIYQYRDAACKVAHETLRYRLANGEKTFLQRRPDGNGDWIWKDVFKDIIPVLYNLPEILAADPGQPVYVVEGEKDVDNLTSKCRLATCNPMGAGKWRDHYASDLAGRHCRIIPDNDQPGREHARQVAGSLQDKAASVKIVDLLQIMPGLPRKGDVSDFLDRGGTVDQLDELADNTAVWEGCGKASRNDGLSSGAVAPSTLANSVQATEPKEKTRSKPPPSHAEILLDLASSTQLFHTPDQRCFARINASGGAETHEIKSTGFRRWITRGFYNKTGKPPSAESLQSALAVLESQATFDGPEEPVYVRVAPGLDGSIFIDLGNGAWSAVKITSGGWGVVLDPPVRFIRPKGMRPLPNPERGGSLDQLQKFLNINDDEWLLFIVWLTQALRPTGPYPVLTLAGEQGTAKSTMAKIARSVIDPHVVMLRSEPRDNRDLMIGACNGWLIALDNVNHLSDWMSDAFCRLATGGGFATRTLCTDTEETYLDATRPVIIAAIEDVVHRGDLADRRVIITLQPIAETNRRTEDSLWALFGAAAPGIMGAILDAVAAGLKNLPAVKLNKLPRMADFAVWGEAVYRGIGKAPGKFLAVYDTNREQASEAVLEGSSVAHQLRAWISVTNKWEGTARDLLFELDAAAGEKVINSKGWPRNARGLSGILRRLAPDLRKIGVDIAFDRISHSRTRMITIEVTASESARDFASPPSPPSPASAKPSKSRDETGDANADGPDTFASPAGAFASPPSPANLMKQGSGDGGDGGDAKSRSLSGAGQTRCETLDDDE